MADEAKKKELIETIVDIIGPIDEWPYLISNLFFSKNVNHAMRPILVAFIFVNGLNPVVKVIATAKARSAFAVLLQTFSNCVQISDFNEYSIKLTYCPVRTLAFL